jgi:hypothetical protein
LDNSGDDGQEDVGKDDYVSADECYDDDDQILSHQLNGAYSSRLATSITSAPRTNDDAPHSEHDALIILSSFCLTLYLQSPLTWS